jgi:hypothetical protein
MWGVWDFLRAESAYIGEEDHMNCFSERVWFERYRLQVISSWPEGAIKQAALASARAALERELAFLGTGSDCARGLA